MTSEHTCMLQMSHVNAMCMPYISHVYSMCMPCACLVYGMCVLLVYQSTWKTYTIHNACKSHTNSSHVI